MMRTKKNKKLSQNEFTDHLPVNNRHKVNLLGIFFRFIWGLFLKAVFKFYIQLKVKGNFKEIYQKYPRLLIISNHASHLDAISIAAAIPFKYWKYLYTSVAKDYWFSSFFMKFFSKQCLNAVPIERKTQWLESIQLCKALLKNLNRIWIIVFPEGTRSKDNYIQNFKGGVSLLSQQTETPILFLYIEGNRELMPKGRHFPKPGKLIMHIGPICPPSSIKDVIQSYKEWVLSINEKAYKKIK